MSTHDVTGQDASGRPWLAAPWSRLLAASLVVHLALSGACAFIFPLGQAPDEPAHFRYALFIARHGRLPNFNVDNAGYESYQAPLYYTLCAAVGKLTMVAAPSGQQAEAGPPEALRASDQTILSRLPQYPTIRPGQHQLALDALRQAHRYSPAERRAWLAMRLLTVIVGAVGILLAWRILILLFPERQWIAGTVSVGMATNPMYAHISGAVGNDPPATVAVGLVLLMAMLVLRHGASARRSALLGLALATAMLTKDSALAALPAALLALAWGVGRRYDPRPAETPLTDIAHRVAAIDWGSFARNAAVTLGVAALFGGWWYVRNQLLYGAPQHFPANVERQISWETYLAQPWLIGTVLSVAIPMAFRNFWAGFGWTNIAVAPAFYWLFAGACIVALFGLLLLYNDRRRNDLDWSALQIRGFWILVMTAALLALAVVWYILTIDFGGGSQGRYMFPAMPALGMLWAVGVGRLLQEDARRHLPVLTGVAMLAFSLYAILGVALPFYQALGVR